MSVDQYVNMPIVEQGPLNLEDEFIRHLVIKESAEYSIRDGVSNDLLYTPKNKAIYSFVQYYFSETGQIPTPTVIKTEFGLDVLEVQSTVQWVIEKLRERYQRNQLQELSFAIAEKSVADPGEALDLLTAKALEIQRNSVSQKHVWSAGDSGLFISELQDKILQGHYQGMPTGFKQVDIFTGGLKPGYLAFLGARPKRMKTFFMIQAFIEQKYAGYKPVFFTLENTEQEIMMRIACMISGYPWDLAQRGVFDDKAWKIISQAWEEFDNLGPHWISRPPQGERTVGALMLQADKLEADSIILSQFKYVEPTNPIYYNRPDHEKWASIVTDLKGAATRPGKERPLYVECQFNREGENIEEFSDMSLSQLGLTDMIGQASDIVFALFQNKEMRDNNQTQFGIVEARNSDKRNWYVRSEFKSGTFLEIQNS